MEGQGLKENITVQELLTNVAEVLNVPEEEKEKEISEWSKALGCASRSLVGLKTLIKKKDHWGKIDLDNAVKALLESAFDDLSAAYGDGKGTVTGAAAGTAAGTGGFPGIPRIAAGVEPLPPPNKYEEFKNPYLHQSKASFFTWRDECYWFCDKTGYLALWDELPDHIIFRRPPRFGKSAWIRILSAYYDIAVDEDTRNYYFGNLQIGGRPPKKSYLIMTFDFTAVARTFWSQADVRRAIFDSLDLFVHKYKGLVEFGNDLLKKDPDPDATTAVHDVVRAVQKAGYEIFLMIDEIDAGAASVLKSFLRGEDDQENMLAGLFSMVKDQLLGPTVARGFAVGITTLTVKDNLTLSVWNDLTDDETLEGICGFDQSDIDDLLQRLPDKGDKLVALKGYLRDTQNGYRFLPQSPRMTTTEEETEKEERQTETSGLHLQAQGRSFYNTSIVLLIIAQYLRGKEFDELAAHDLLPEKLLVLFKTGGHEVMMQLLYELAGTPVNLACPETPFAYIETVDTLANRDACLRLLLSAGFLTFQSSEHLKVPNKLVHHVISGIAIEWKLEPNSLQAMRAASLQFFTGDPGPLVSYIETNEYPLISTRDGQGASELAFKMLLLPRWCWTAAYIVTSEDVVKGGFIDVLLQRTKKGRRTVQNRDLIVELKYFKLKQLQGQSHVTLEGMEPSALRDLYVDLRSQKREGKAITQPTKKKQKVLGSSVSSGKQVTLQDCLQKKEKKKDKEKEKETEGSNGSQKVKLAEVERRACLQALNYARQKKKTIEALSGPSAPLIITLVSLGWSRILFRTWEMEEAVGLAKEIAQSN